MMEPAPKRGRFGVNMINNDHLNVLMFGWELPPQNSGGLGVACLGLSKNLAAQGVHISFALPRPLDANIPYLDLLPSIIDGVEITAINSHLQAYRGSRNCCSRWDKDYELNLIVDGPSMHEEAIQYGRVGELWARTKPHDLIHVHDWMTYPAGMNAAAYSGKPLIAHVHATEFDRTGGNVDPQIAEIEYQGLSAATKIIAVSKYTKNIIHQKYSIPLEKITVVHNGIDVIPFNAADVRRVFPHDKIVLYVGRLTFQKGVEYFLHAAKQVLINQPNTVFIVAGSGDMERQLIMQSAYLNIGNRVIFTGFTQGDELQSLYAMADVFVMPSVSEPYGLVALEAVSAGIPTIISKQSGVSEALDHVSKIDFWDTQAIARQVISILRYPRIARERALNAQLQAQKLTWERAASSTIRLYQSLVS